MKVDLDISELVNVDETVKLRIKELEKENSKLKKQNNALKERISNLHYSIDQTSQYEIKYENLKAKVKEFLKAGRY